MAVLVYSAIQTLYLQALQADVSVNLPVTIDAGSEAMNDINEAYSTIWELSGGRLTAVKSSAAWTLTSGKSSDTSGVATTKLNDIGEILNVWSKAGDTVGAAGDNLLVRRPLPEIQHLRARGTTLGSYSVPKIYSITASVTSDNTDATALNIVRMDYFPGVTDTYFPIEYVPQFVPLTATTDYPDVNDIQSRDIALIAARYRAPLIGRAELAPDIAARISEKTQLLLARKASAGQEAKQGR